MNTESMVWLEKDMSHVKHAKDSPKTLDIVRMESWCQWLVAGVKKIVII